MFMYSIVGHKTSSLLCMGVNFRQDKMLPKLAWPVPISFLLDFGRSPIMLHAMLTISLIPLQRFKISYTSSSSRHLVVIYSSSRSNTTLDLITLILSYAS